MKALKNLWLLLFECKISFSFDIRNVYTILHHHISLLLNHSHPRYDQRVPPHTILRDSHQNQIHLDHHPASHHNHNHLIPLDYSSTYHTWDQGPLLETVCHTLPLLPNIPGYAPRTFWAWSLISMYHHGSTHSQE